MGNEELKELESIKKLLIISLLEKNVSPKAIEKATDIAEKTIRNTFPAALIKKSRI